MSKSTVIFGPFRVFSRQAITKTLNNIGQVLKNRKEQQFEIKRVLKKQRIKLK